MALSVFERRNPVCEWDPRDREQMRGLKNKLYEVAGEDRESLRQVVDKSLTDRTEQPTPPVNPGSGTEGRIASLEQRVDAIIRLLRSMSKDLGSLA